MRNSSSILGRHLGVKWRKRPLNLLKIVEVTVANNCAGWHIQLPTEVAWTLPILSIYGMRYHCFEAVEPRYHLSDILNLTNPFEIGCLGTISTPCCTNPSRGLPSLTCTGSGREDRLGLSCLILFRRWVRRPGSSLGRRSRLWYDERSNIPKGTLHRCKPCDLGSPNLLLSGGDHE